MTDIDTEPTERLTESEPGSGFSAQRFQLKPFPVQVGPVGHIAAERDRLSALRFEHFDVKRLGATVGAELHGIDLTTELPDSAIAEIARALSEFKVIFFRDQPITAQQHLDFAKRFGDLETHPFLISNEAQPELVRFEKSAEVAGYENAWHHDVTWRERPSKAVILHAIEVPELGGDTLFADMYAAWDGLTSDVQARIEHLDGAHDFVRTFGAFIPADQLESVQALYPQVRHPLVCTHEVTGRRHLYANRNFLDHIVGLGAEESVELIDLLCRQADYPEYQCRFRWEPHSIAFWDNRAVQHYASSDYWPNRRVMERASIVGPRPTR